jgi:hypothetical protein
MIAAIGLAHGQSPPVHELVLLALLLICPSMKVVLWGVLSASMNCASPLVGSGDAL